MVSLGLLLLIMLNPIALFIYLTPIMDELSDEGFGTLIWKATIIATLVYVFFVVTGKYIFLQIFQIDFESFRLFGGVIIFSLAFMFIVGGRESFIHMKPDINDMASQLALPFMVGAGSVSVSILIGSSYGILPGLGILGVVMLLNMLIIWGVKWIRDTFFLGAWKTSFRNILSVVFRLNSFFMGAIGIDMSITAIKTLFGL